MREAESAYRSGAKKMALNDLDGADRDFQRANKLNPADQNYALAISLVREHRVNELVQRASKARLAGDEKTATALLEKARAIDPQSQMVIEHSGAFDLASAHHLASGSIPALQIKGPFLAGPIQLHPAQGTKNFDLRGQSTQVLASVASAYGITAIIDESVQQKDLHFNLQHATYSQAMSVLMDMAHTFFVPVEGTSIIVADDVTSNHDRLDRQMQETVYVPSLTPDQMNELFQVIGRVFDIKKATVEPTIGALVIRAPQAVLDPLNTTLHDLIGGSGEIMLDVKLYETSTTHATNLGATVPQQFTVFNVNAAADQIVNQNQALVQQAIAQGLPADTSNLEIAVALIKLGLVQSSFATNLIGVFGGPITSTNPYLTGISTTSSPTATLNLSHSATDTRTLDDIQVRIANHQDAVFREGERYPIVQATYSTGISSASAALGNATINGVPVSSLLSQFTGGSTAVVPQVTYEDLGVTLKATPIIEKSGRINLTLDLKIEALSGSSLDGNPILDSRQFSSTLTIANGESAMMVSNVTRSESAALTGLPVASELPGLNLPLNKDTNGDTGQLIVVVTPRIVRQRANLFQGPRIPMAGSLED
jgi:general secretion pathway protein D